MSTTGDIPYFVLTVLCAVSFILNGTFLIVICKNWTLLKRRRITYHVTSLAISDYLVGARGFCIWSIKLATGKTTSRLSSVFRIILGMAFLISLLAVCLMAIERSLCIKKPLTWNKILPLKRILKIMAVNWVFSPALVILMHFYTSEVSIILAVLFCIPIFVTAFVYINLYVKISKSSDVHDGTQQSSSIGERQKKLTQQKVANLVLILTLVLVITIAPTLLAMVSRESCILLNCKFIGTMTTIVTYSRILAILNFIVNPILYAWRINLYRQAFWKMLGRGIEMRTNNYVVSYSVQDNGDFV